MCADFRQHGLCVVSLLALVMAIALRDVGAEDRPSPEPGTSVSHLDDIWNGGDRRAYYREVIRLTKEIESMPASRLRIGIAANVLENLLSREGPVPEAYNGDLPAMEVCVLRVLFNPSPSTDDRREHVLLLSRFLGRVRAEKIQDYTPRPAYENVTPPQGAGFGYSGMPPAAIEDPAERAQYEAAIRQNQENMSMNHRQQLLRTFDESLSHYIVAYMIDTVRQEETSEALIADCIEIARLTPQEKNRLERAVRAVAKGENGESPDADGDMDASDRPWLPPEALAAPVIASRPIRPFVPSAQPVAPGLARHAVVRVHWRSQLLPAMQTIAAQYPNASRLDIGFDDRASFGHFCAPDSPYDAVLLQARLTNLETRLGQGRFPESGPQPDAYLIGHLRVVFVVHEANRVESLEFAGIRTALSESGKQLGWDKLGGAASTVVRAYGPRDNTWARQLVQDKCMTRWRDSDQPGVRHLQQLDFREDLVACADAKEVIARVRADRHALGFFPCCEPLATRDLQGVNVLPVAENAGGTAIQPPLGLTVNLSYPLAEPLFLYVHPNAPDVAREFGQFACGDDAGKVWQAAGVFPIAVRTAAEREQRVADAKAGKGAPVAVCDPAGMGNMLHDMSFEFARAKMTVQVTLDAAGGSVERAVERLETGAAELLVVDGRLGEAVRGRVVEAGGAEAVLGSRAVGVVVHPHNPFNELAKDDVRQILSGKVDRWPGMTGTAERIVLYGLPVVSPLMRMVDEVLWPRGIGFQPVSSEEKRGPSGRADDKLEAGGKADDKLEAHPTKDDKLEAHPRKDDKLEAYPTERATMTRRPDTGRVILSVAAQPGAMGLVDLTEFPRHETKVKLLAILPPDERQAAAPASDRLPEDYPFAQPVHLYLSGKASDAAKAFFAFVAEGNAREGLLAHGVVPRAAARERTPHTEAMAVMPADFRDVVLGDFEEEAEEEQDTLKRELQQGEAAEDTLKRELQQGEVAEDALKRELQQGDVAEGALPVEFPDDDPFRLPAAKADASGDGTAASGSETEATTTGAAGAEAGDSRRSLAESADEAPSAGAADGFDVWARANAVPLVLASLAALLLAVVLATAITRRNRRRNDLLRRYRS